ncbi:MAG: cytochrome b/b6 domain-containing protein [Bdellovibrionales bacterium]|nr:cytochrome b/b6 domain-containing protein [Bdellovibrionales bacterium]
MNSVRAYDLPVRIFHWAFVTLFSASFFIAKVIDDESALYVYHMLSGLLMASLVLLRIIWGFVGTETARFKSFRLSPKELKEYFLSLVSSKTKRYLGHNPASSYAAVVMFILALGLAATGILMSLRVSKHFFEEVHELMANGFLLLSVAHILGVIFHQVKHQDGLAMSMIHGLKYDIDSANGIKISHGPVAIVLVAYILFGGFVLGNGYNPNTGELHLLGATLPLGEKEEHSSHDGFAGEAEHDQKSSLTGNDDDNDDDHDHD